MGASAAVGVNDDLPARESRIPLGTADLEPSCRVNKVFRVLIQKLCGNDRLDDELLELLSRRREVSREIGRYKKEHSLPVVQTGRYKDLMEKRVADGEKLDMSADFVRALLAVIHEESVRQQVEI